MPFKEVVCPALTRGVVGACRFCIFTEGGGASDKCIRYSEIYDKRKPPLGTQSQTPSKLQPALPDIAINTPSKGADDARKNAMLSMGDQYTVGD